MDEITLARTLHQLAANPPLHPAPSADARRRASRLRRNRRTGGAGLAVVVAVGVFGSVELQPAAKPGLASTTQSWVKELTNPDNPNHATTGYVGLSRAAGGQWIVYWQGQRLCDEIIGATGVALGSHCSVPMPTPTSMTPAIAADSNNGTRNLGAGDGGLFFAVAPAVTLVGLHTLPGPTVFQDGTSITHYSSDDAGLTPVGEADFPASVVVAEGTVVSMAAFDNDGHQVGAAIPGPAAPQLRQVIATFDCPGAGQTRFDAVVPDRADPKSCYGLAPASMTLVPKSVDALDDATLGWLVQVSLNQRDVGTFGTLTERLTSQEQPQNQLAIVFDGKVQSAPTIASAITGGVFEITGGADAFSKEQAQELAAQMAPGVAPDRATWR